MEGERHQEQSVRVVGGVISVDSAFAAAAILCIEQRGVVCRGSVNRRSLLGHGRVCLQEVVVLYTLRVLGGWIA